MISKIERALIERLTLGLGKMVYAVAGMPGN
nr:phage protein Gp37 [Mannheimia haemolytica]